MSQGMPSYPIGSAPQVTPHRKYPQAKPRHPHHRKCLWVMPSHHRKSSRGPEGTWPVQPAATVVASCKAGVCSEAGAWLGPQPPGGRRNQCPTWLWGPAWGWGRKRTVLVAASRSPHILLSEGPTALRISGGTNKAGRARAVLPGTPTTACHLWSPVWAASNHAQLQVMTTPGRLHTGSLPPRMGHSALPGSPPSPRRVHTHGHTDPGLPRGRHTLPQPVMGG